MINRIRNWLAIWLHGVAGHITPPTPPGKVSVWLSMSSNPADFSPDEAKELSSAAYRQIATMCREQACLKKIDAAFERALPQHLRETGGI